MAGITGRTPRARGLGAALREERDRAGLTQREVARRMGQPKAQGSMSYWERGERMPDQDDVTAYLDALGVTGERREEILSMVTDETDSPSWLALSLPEQHAQQAALLRFERGARIVTHVAPNLVPGPLQTEDYMRRIMESDPDITSDEIETRVAVRIGRRNLITRENPAMLRVLLGEAALRQGDDLAVMVKQVKYLLEMARYPNVEIRVVPFRAGWLGGMFGLIESDEGTVVHVDAEAPTLFFHEPHDVDRYRRKAAAIEEKAMSLEASIGLMADIAREMEATI